MNLTQYLKSTGEKPYLFADRAGVSRPLIYDLLKMEAGGKARNIKIASGRKIVTASRQSIDLSNLGVPGPAQ